MGLDAGSFKGIQAVDAALHAHFSGHVLDDLDIACFIEQPMTETQASSNDAESKAATGRVFPSVSIQLISGTPDWPRSGGRAPYYFENYRGFDGENGSLGDAPDPPRVSKFDAPDPIVLLYSIDWWSKDAPVDRLLLELFWRLVPDGRGFIRLPDPFDSGKETTAWILRQSGPFTLTEASDDRLVYHRSSTVSVIWELDNRPREDQIVLDRIDRVDLTIYKQPKPPPEDISELDTDPLEVLDSDSIPTFP